MATQIRRNIYLVSTKDDIKESKLPSKGEVLSNFLHCHQQKKLTIRTIAAEGVEEVMKFWPKSRFSTIRKDHSIANVDKLITTDGFVKYRK